MPRVMAERIKQLQLKIAILRRTESALTLKRRLNDAAQLTYLTFQTLTQVNQLTGLARISKTVCMYLALSVYMSICPPVCLSLSLWAFLKRFFASLRQTAYSAVWSTEQQIRLMLG